MRSFLKYAFPVFTMLVLAVAIWLSHQPGDISGMESSHIAALLGITPTTLSFKLNGKSPILLKECVKIKNGFFPDKTLDYLFATDNKKGR